MEATLSSSRVAFAIITISCCFSCFTSSPAIACPLAERNHLLDFKAAVVDEDSTLSSWHGFNCCKWSGVGCNFGTGHVSLLDLSGYNLEGDIHSSLFELAELEHLDLSDNFFQGNWNLGGDLSFIERQNSPSLTTIILSSTVVEGKIPSAIGNISSLERLLLSNTSIEGEIPLSIVNLSKLVRLDLLHNNLTGVIPPSLGSLSSLSYLDLSYNQFTGPIPHTISNLVSLKYLWLESNSLNGSISLSLFHNLTRLEYLFLSNNHLIVSSDPLWIPQFKNLQALRLSSCKLDRIPPFLVTQYNLGQLDLSANSITTNIPSWIWDLTSLYYLNLSCNQLTGLLPSRLTSMHLLYLDLHNNSLEGPLPLPPDYLYSLEGPLPLPLPPDAHV